MSIPLLILFIDSIPYQFSYWCSLCSHRLHTRVTTITNQRIKDITVLQMNCLLCGQMFVHLGCVSSLCCDQCWAITQRKVMYYSHKHYTFIKCNAVHYLISQWRKLFITLLITLLSSYSIKWPETRWFIMTMYQYKPGATVPHTNTVKGRQETQMSETHSHVPSLFQLKTKRRNHVN